MKYPVKVFEVPPPVNGVHGKPRLIREFDVMASNLEKVRRMVLQKIHLSDHDLRSLSFSPLPEPHGSVIVHVMQPREHKSITRHEKQQR